MHAWEDVQAINSVQVGSLALIVPAEAENVGPAMAGSVLKDHLGNSVLPSDPGCIVSDFL